MGDGGREGMSSHLGNNWDNKETIENISHHDLSWLLADEDTHNNQQKCRAWKRRNRRGGATGVERGGSTNPFIWRGDYLIA